MISSPMVIVSTSDDDPISLVSLSSARQVILVAKSSMIAKTAKDNFFMSSPFLSFCSTVNVLVLCVCGLFLTFASSRSGKAVQRIQNLMPILLV